MANICLLCLGVDGVAVRNLFLHLTL